MALPPNLNQMERTHMKSFPKLTPCPWDSLVAVGILCLAVGCFVWLLPEDSDHLEAVISVEGTQVSTIPIDETGVYPFSGQGYHLIVNIENGEVWVSQADCPTQDCVHTGHINMAGQSIVCLPGQISIRLEGADHGVDLVVG